MVSKKRNTDWDVRTNLNAKPGAQGTLFSGGTKYSSDARYPRGYTPERLHEAANAIGGDVTGERGYTRGQGARAHYFRDYKYSGTAGRADSSARRTAVDNLARSTVPAEDLQPAPGRTLNFWIDPAHDQGLMDRNARGEYYATSPAQASRHDLYVHTQAADSPTLIHEIGHHASNIQGTEHSAYDTPARQGKEEGFADAYSFKHFRDRRGKPLSELRTYPSATVASGPQARYPDHEGKQRVFVAGYQHGRGEIPVEDQFAKYMHREPSVMDTENWKASQQGQGTLFNISTWRDRGTGPEQHRFFEHEGGPSLK